ncbi:type IV secretory system conjugative DNA transfer family protein [Nostoc sp. FACHB-87]|uniref:type IV secretory system conjugative DNA transfer family protein n=1 Tax=Nostocales TaxID=1161 RepID=UPI00168A39BF|nr:MULTISPECIES: TraM recognition domain-containing protein [Nostocales]MBD2303394.1 type IV secretory system conjugative DNA transfer family protein [Nostoc sp. FACHB-190]MBD2458987.1 type IV secretory system conjugative DNA transfer family protein [Nostoc sp. FACHB-87]MBD2479998.1 type IV secretory system conjugative DNA transfer family protein [Anabaena sp. FACHB-83]MBD2492466.1 type IV secretory system conjugative DNA transfer family protein [Aulosira sp. FACHB-615]
MTQTTSTVNPNQLVPPGLESALISPAGLGILFCGLLIIIAKYIDGKGGKGKLATARWGGSTEKAAARKLGCKQIQARKHNRVSLFVGTPENTKTEIVKGRRITQIPEDKRTLYLPEAQRGILVAGGPGSGKSFSMVTPLLRSAIDQGFPVILYDFKYAEQESATAASKGQAPSLAGYALERGYKVTVLAPGFPESAVANPIDFLRNNEDSEMARQLAITLNRNFQLGSDSSGNDFFTNAGDQLVQAVFMLAKGTKYPDIMMCQAILGLPKLVYRIEQAEDMNFMVREAFAQFVSVAGSPETAASIVGTASGLFSRFMVPAALAAFCGKTNIPLDLKGRQMVIFGMNKEKRDVIAPLLVSILHLLVSRNVAGKRTCPLVLGIDELPTLYLPALVDWLNQNREDGLVSILGLQNLSMLEEAYGENTTNAIFGGCATKAFFNPQDDIAAERFSNFLGDFEIKYKQRSRSSGGSGGASTSNSDQNSTRKLFEINQFNTLPEGKAVIISPGFRSRGQISLPILEKIKIPQRDIKSEAQSIKIWYEFQSKLASQSTLQTPANEEMKIRREEAQRLLPLIENKEQLEEIAALI